MAHLCIGQSQCMAQFGRAPAGTVVVRRALGGGAVWIDPRQWCYVYVVPGVARLGAGDWFERLLVPAISTFRHFGLDVRQCGNDLWIDNRKIAGSGAATIGEAFVLGSSFMLRFPAKRFAACMAGTIARDRSELLVALRAGVTDWRENGRLPSARALRSEFAGAIEGSTGWTLVRDRLRADERPRSLRDDNDCADLGCGNTERAAAVIRINARVTIPVKRRY